MYDPITGEHIAVQSQRRVNTYVVPVAIAACHSARSWFGSFMFGKGSSQVWTWFGLAARHCIGFTSNQLVSCMTAIFIVGVLSRTIVVSSASCHCKGV